jgi:HK97 family phage major capsid protein
MATDKTYSLTRALSNAQTHNSPEFETHYKLAKENEGWKSKFSIGSAATRQGMSTIQVPWLALRPDKKLKKRDLSTATGASGTFTVGTDVQLGVQASLRPTSIMAKLPVTFLENCQGSVVLPRISSGVSPSQLSELQNFTSADPAFSATHAGPQRLSASVTFSRQLLQQSVNSSIDAVLANELCRAISFQLDTNLIAGSGVNGQAIGLINQNATSTNTYVAAGAWGQLMSAQKQIEDNSIDADNAFWLISSATAKTWRTTLRTGNTARYVLDQSSRVGEISAYATSFIPASSDQTVLADFTQLVVATFGQGVELTFDPFTKASTGEVVITANLYYQFFCRRPQAFVVSTNAGSIFTS